MQADIERQQFENALHAFQQGDLTTAIEQLKQLLANTPDNDNYRIALANLYIVTDTPQLACELFSDDEPNSCYNKAYYAAKAGLAEMAIGLFERAISSGLRDPAEAYNHIGILHREELLDDISAETAFKKALSLSPSYSPAKINLANLYEDQGHKESATSLLMSFKNDDNFYPTSLARLAAMQRDGSLISTLKDCLPRVQHDPEIRCNLLYELGHQWEAKGNYQEAWHAFQSANTINAQLMRPFDAQAWHRRYVQATQKSHEPFKPIARNVLFICGMFRSGSTLLEQMLAAHPAIAAGGELTLFPKLHSHLNQHSKQQAITIYLRQLDAVSKGKRWVTDKRPDNIWYINTIKRLFPHAKIIITERELRDNALSIYQQRLAPAMNYACHPDHIVEYAQLCDQLKHHWLTCYPDDVFIVKYESLVNDPEATIDPLLKMMGLTWDDACLNFHQLNNTVKTASVWQVRKALNQKSIGRSTHYPEFLPNVSS
ncbi:MAG TPA: sulfotransferase [Pseudomonadales bacterium]|nr:sulfotransferase [Pseudomonadales bacterium]